MHPVVKLFPLTAVLALGACVVPPPSGPSVMALPGPNRDFAAFQQDDAYCRQFASWQSGNPQQAAAQSALGSAALGTVAGAAAGALIGAAGRNPGAGAALGAGTGLALGSVAGSNAAWASAGNIQARFDMAYTQCMIAQGNTVQPGPGGSQFAGFGSPAVVGVGVVPTIGLGWGWGRGWGPGWGPGWGWHGAGWRGRNWGWRGGGWRGGGWRGGRWR